VPHTRGPERYRSSREIVEEIARLVDAGVREITLLGQTVNSYRDPLQALPRAPGHGQRPFGRARRALAAAEDSEFAALLFAIAEQVPGLLRLRYTSPHPRHLSLALIRAHLELPVLARHVHLPVQSGSDRVLKRMLRRYTVGEYLERTAALMEMVPGVTLSTDVIVGFPGETPEDFEATLELVERVKFTGLFGFKYSERPYTPARRLADDVSETEKGSRLARLFALSGRLRRRHLEALVGQTASVLVEGPNRQQGFTGRTERNEIVHFRPSSDPTGTIVPVTIVAAHDNSLSAEPLHQALRPTQESALRHEPARETKAARRTLPVLLS
jgi:tRNA-2-methylthio-N6-dimethylallyladenosine synthase